MGQLIHTNGDYNIKTRTGGDITLNTGPGVGRVLVTGNLVVEGDTLTVSAENLNVNDNVIVLNYGETGPGISLRYAGIQIDRGGIVSGTYPTDANSGAGGTPTLAYDEVNDIWNFSHSDPSLTTFAYSNSRIRVREIFTDTDTDDGDLGINVGNGGVIKVISSGGNYRSRVTADDHIPNKAYVDFEIQNTPTFQISADTLGSSTRVICADKDVLPNTSDTTGSLAYLAANTTYDTDEDQSAVTVIVDGRLASQFYTSYGYIYGLEINGSTIETTDSDASLFLKTGNGKIYVDNSVGFELRATDPTYDNTTTTVYSKQPSTGDTGFYFVNSNSVTGEFISKKRALLFSMLF